MGDLLLHSMYLTPTNERYEGIQHRISHILLPSLSLGSGGQTWLLSVSISCPPCRALFPTIGLHFAGAETLVTPAMLPQSRGSHTKNCKKLYLM
ncbi:hypothetical protein AVEN_216057-1 [Araneus ventricosus]|uniref:Uncharacterized protein n=1 Tax=Araneus ventricosus TaxID=182803 RepID=A0A4Y2VUP6_ARAVE|nr:hypothetical protein AVEN_216057-1 [Araneus ventricosus]